jgi:carboxyl-terminal processing protease
MTTRTRFWVLLVSTPVMAFALVGGYLGQVMAKDGTFQHLRVFEDVVSLVVNNYVEEVDVHHAMQGALKGLAEGLDPDSAYLTPELVKAHDPTPPPAPPTWAWCSSASTISGSCRCAKAPRCQGGTADRRFHPRHR